MLIPKASHLVERVAERLLRSGDLDDSAAQLLRGGDPAADAAEHQAPSRGAALLAAEPPVPPQPLAQPQLLAQPEPEPPPSSKLRPRPSQRSSLFKPPPAPAQPAAPPAAHVANPAGAPGGLPASGETPRPAAGQAPASYVPPLPSPAIIGQARLLGQAAPLNRPEDFAASVPPPGQRGVMSDPAAGLLQGPTSVDAVSLERAGMVDWSRTRTRISEEFRLVQRQIIRSAFGPGAEPGFSNLLLVTSARPGEGKSFMSTNLSGSIARQGDHHVLLVDADSKRDSICYSLGLAQARGLLDLAANPKLDPAPLIVKTPIERLSILPVGRERERSAELFSTKEMTRLIQSLGRRYADRLLILDAPPCLSTSDPAVLAQVVGQILFVVEADRTQRDEIEASLDLIQACPTITMVLNKQQISSRYTFGAYSSYYSS
jgi:receptor protein-tyrosine kinase